MPDKIASFGVKLYKTSIASANEIANVISIGDWEITREEIDATTHSDSARRKLGTLRNSEPLNVRIAFDPQDADQVALLSTDTLSSTPHTTHPTWVFTFKSNGAGTKKASVTFSGFVKSFKTSALEVDGLTTAEVVFAVDGDYTFDADDTTTP